MKLVQYFTDGTITFNWDQLPEHIRSQTHLRDDIFKNLQERLKPTEFVTTKILYDLNKYVIDRIKSECKIRSLPLKKS